MHHFFCLTYILQSLTHKHVTPTSPKATTSENPKHSFNVS